MTIKEGRILLQSCIEQYECVHKFENIIIYKTGNKLHANMYQKDIISTRLPATDWTKNARYVIKCFIHTEIYVAWEAKDFRFKDTYICYKSTLEEMENGKLGNWYESPENGNDKFYLFKGREGVMKFVCDKIIPIK